MVLGLNSKHKKKRPLIKVDYIIHIQEIKPWPPSEALKPVQTVLLQWENGDQNSGSFLSVAGDSNIKFNESFILSSTLKRDKKDREKFKKNHLEFSLFNPRKDKAKGPKLLGSASINLGDYGLIDDVLRVNAPLIFKKSSNNNSLPQPALAISLEMVEKEGSNSSPGVGFSNEALLDNDDDYDYEDDEESEVASYTDDDNASSHSSRTTGSLTFEVANASPSRNEKNGYGNSGNNLPKGRNKNLWPSSTDPSPDPWNKVKDHVSLSKFSERSMSYVKKNTASPLITSSPTSISFRDFSGKVNNIVSSNIPHDNQHNARLKHAKSVRINSSDKGNGFLNDTYLGGKPTDLDIPNGSQKKVKSSDVSDGKNEWKTRAEMFKEELREVAAIEVGLYSIVAEHLSSVNKVHAPARRISRFYKNACQGGTQAKRASAARAAVSGLVLVSKSCGNDVPRLTFWLSNTIMLRAIVSQTATELPHSINAKQSKSVEEPDDCEDVLTFIIALEKVESWLFSRIVESVWWQTFTPHMQPTAAKSSVRNTSSSVTKKTNGRRNNLGNNEQVKYSIELWKKAFKDACERLCPIRAGGQECGCLSALIILVMEQLVNRLDVAMFNAIVRKSAEELPTDPVSDPIGNSKVLPVPAGKSSFSAGAQLKNVIGNWSRWLTDLFGLEDDVTEDNVVLDHHGKKPKSFKAFRLLHALSDLMMLPFGMLADPYTRKEVCPIFGPTIIKRVLSNFVPDEFFPDPIPQSIIDALNAEDISDSSRNLLTIIPCIASPTKYSPPPAALLTCVGEVGSQVLKSNRLSTLKKSYTSDDELDELDTPLTSIVPDSFHSSSALAKLSLMPKEKGGRNVLRYQLLREIWKDDE